MNGLVKTLFMLIHKFQKQSVIFRLWKVVSWRSSEDVSIIRHLLYHPDVGSPTTDYRVRASANCATGKNGNRFITCRSGCPKAKCFPVNSSRGYCKAIGWRRLTWRWKRLSLVTRQRKVKMFRRQRWQSKRGRRKSSRCLERFSGGGRTILLTDLRCWGNSFLDCLVTSDCCCCFGDWDEMTAYVARQSKRKQY